MTDTEKNIQIYDSSKTVKFYPATKGALVTNDNGEALGGVEAGAQVNIIETVKVNGTALTVSSKAVDITVPTQSEYTIAKATTAEDGYVSTYVFTKDGTQVGDKINIPKDLVVESGSVKTVTTADTPVEGYAVGDKYIDLVLANADDQHIYILVSDLVDTYVAGTGITITGNSISVDSSAVALTSSLATVATTGSYNDLSDKPTIPTVDQTYSATSANAQSGVAVASAISGKADSATTLAGYGITDAYTKDEITAMNLMTYTEIV